MYCEFSALLGLNPCLYSLLLQTQKFQEHINKGSWWGFPVDWDALSEGINARKESHDLAATKDHDDPN